jgi:hypothetical protein
MRIRWVGHVSYMGEMRNTCRIFVGKSEGPLERHRHTWEDNIKMDLHEMGFGCVDWSHVS